MLEDVAPFHLRKDTRFVTGNDFLRNARRVAAGSALQPELFGVLAVGVQVSRQNSALAIRFGTDDDSTRAIAEDYGHFTPASRQIDSGRMDLGANYQDMVVRTGLHELV